MKCIIKNPETQVSVGVMKIEMRNAHHHSLCATKIEVGHIHPSVMPGSNSDSYRMGKESLTWFRCRQEFTCTDGRDIEWWLLLTFNLTTTEQR